MTAYWPKRWLSPSRLSSLKRPSEDMLARGWVHRLAPSAEAESRAKLLGKRLRPSLIEAEPKG